ncbi:hypothetical protein A0J61_05841 [Choanephora cucurbitarum]|uniref:Uncharacterized protein n=1 Tax=Choanephora cucurbitarum TaxID=101091 RepID=A0A1C7NAF6_9FUNG|nr:hypothetical protein A0J61_05841 [Choanephora cucurbitarum]
MSDNLINDIHSISYSKLAEYDQARIDLPIRKYVLIANLLRDPSTPPVIDLEQHWFDSCIDELDKDEQEDNPEDSQGNSAQSNYQNNHHNNNKQYANNTNIHLHAFYHIRHGNGFLVCTSKI